MLSRLVRIQLVGFAAVTGVTALLMALNYVQVPAMLGIGRYDVRVELAEAGGLYPRANVTYRGTEVGVVTSVDVREGATGAVATLQLDDDVEIPADAVAEVRSVSALGEQYVDFVPPEGSTAAATLRDGDVVPESRTVLPTTTGELLTSVDSLVTSVPQDDLRTTVDELGAAFEGRADDLGRMIDASLALIDEATRTLPETVELVDAAPKVLATQADLDPSIRSLVTSLDGVTGQFAASDRELRSILDETSPLVTEFADFTGELGEVLPQMLTDLEVAGEVLRAYVPGLEHILTILPPALSVTVGLNSPDQDAVAAGRREMNLYFRASVNEPPPCTEGYADAGKERSPYRDVDLAPIPKTSYCKVPSDDPRVVRGARNQPCPNDPARRGPTAEACGLVFDRAAIARTAFLVKNDMVDAPEEIGRLVAPEGQMFLTDPALASPPDQDWGAFLEGLVG